MTETPDDPLAAVLTAGRREVDSAVLSRASVDLARDIASATPRGRRRRVVTLALATAVVVTPTAAAAYAWSTHTGVFGRPDLYTEEVDGSEWLDLCAPDFRATAERLAPADLPLPAGLTLRTVRADLFGTPSPDCSGAGARQQATGVARSYENYAWCSWVHVYVDGPRRHDAAASAMRALANSDLALAVDPERDVVAFDNEIVDAAEAGDVARVRHEARVNCHDFGWKP